MHQKFIINKSVVWKIDWSLFRYSRLHSSSKYILKWNKHQVAWLLVYCLLSILQENELSRHGSCSSEPVFRPELAINKKSDLQKGCPTDVLVCLNYRKRNQMNVHRGIRS